MGEGVPLAARVVPSPRSISDDARAFLERMVGIDGVPLNALHKMPDPDDLEGWADLKKAVDAHYAAGLVGSAAGRQSRVETITVGQTVIHVARPEAEQSEKRAFIDLHGGAFVFGGGDGCRASARMQAERHGVIGYGVDYRMPPDHPFPAAVDDCVAAYRHVLERHEAVDVVIGGRSAGGNLAVATLLRARAEGLPMPACLVLLSPEVDLTESGDSHQANQMLDVVLPRTLMPASLLYADGADLRDPLVSPLFGDLAGLPPTLLQTGTRDLLLSSTVRMHGAMRRAGVPAELHVFEAMPHGVFGGAAPEDHELAEEVARFVRGNWSR